MNEIIKYGIIWFVMGGLLTIALSRLFTDVKEFEKACKASNLVEFIEKEGGK